MIPDTWRFVLTAGLAPQDCVELAALLSGIAATGIPLDSAPVIAPLMAFSYAGADGIFQHSADLPGEILIHESLEIVVHQQLIAGHPLSVDASLQTSGAQSRAITITAELRNAADNPVVSVKARLRRVSVETLSNLKPLALARATKNAEMLRFETRPVTQGEVTRYTGLAGDRNPLHVDVQHARGAGLKTTVIPGALLAGLLEPVLAALKIPHQIRTLRVRFAAPHFTGEPVGFAISGQAISDLPRTGGLRVFICRPGDGVTAIADVTLG